MRIARHPREADRHDPDRTRQQGRKLPIWYPSTIALNIKSEEVERMAAEVATLAGETKTGAVRQALRERRDRLTLESGSRKRLPGSLLRFLETEIWPQIPDELLDRSPMTKAEREEILGIGPEGY